MKIETENAIRSILSLDDQVGKAELEKAIMILHGKVESDDDLVHVLRYKEVMALLHVHRRTLEYYIAKGYLDRVYGRGERALGISRDSYLRFTTHRTVVRNKPKTRFGAGAGGTEKEITFRHAISFEPHNAERKHK